jgi:hypothetical protein
MTMEINTTVVTKNNYEVITGKTGLSQRTAQRVAYERKRPSVKRSFFPATPFDAQSLAGTGALVFEGEMIGGGH